MFFYVPAWHMWLSFVATGGGWGGAASTACTRSQAQSMAEVFDINMYLLGHELLNILPELAMALGHLKPEPRNLD